MHYGHNANSPNIYVECDLKHVSKPCLFAIMCGYPTKVYVQEEKMSIMIRLPKLGHLRQLGHGLFRLAFAGRKRRAAGTVGAPGTEYISR